MAEDKDVDKPFTSGALKSKNDVDYWRWYCSNRPAPDENFFRIINDFHKNHGHRFSVAHDVGSGPGNLGVRLAQYYDHVVCSDVNEGALAAGPYLIDGPTASRMTFVTSPAEDLEQAGVPPEVGFGRTDLALVGECMPLLDAPRAMNTFHRLLRPFGTLAISFYGRPVFVDGNSDECNELYGKVGNRIAQFYLPPKDSPGNAFRVRSAQCLLSWLDNIEFNPEQWTNVERHKWNTRTQLIFNAGPGLQDDVPRADARHFGEKTYEVLDPTFWQKSWDCDQVKRYLDSIYPGWNSKVGVSQPEVNAMFDDLEKAMGGKGVERKVTFPVVLLLASKK